MTTYVVVGTVVGLVLWWVWFTYLFPKVTDELSGAAGGGQGRTWIVALVSLAVLAAAAGTFIKNRNVLDLTDTVRLGFKIWFGFLLPATAVLWAATRKSVTAGVALAGYWLVQALLLALLADWLLLK